jgi:hypothetical protein
MTQRERDRLVVLKKAEKKLITQRQAAVELQVSERHIRAITGQIAEDGRPGGGARSTPAIVEPAVEREDQGEKLYLIHMIDDATSELLGRFVRSDSTKQNLRLLQTYLERHGRPVAFYTDKAALFRTAPKVGRTNGNCRETNANHSHRPRSDGRCGNWESCGFPPTRRRPKGALSGASGPPRTGW